jgi:YidC/Oxa1 family membrane protein insertase
MTTPGISDGMWSGLMGKLLYVPMLNLLVFFYTVIPGSDLGLAIIALTLLIRLILHPSYSQSISAQDGLQRVQPYIDKIREEFKDNPQAQSKAIMDIYKEHKVSPWGSCLPLLIQLPIVLALYRVFVAGLADTSLVHLYGWFPNPPTELHTVFLGAIDLAHPSIYLAIAAGLAQFWQSWLTQKHNPASTKAMGPMNPQIITYTFPLITIFIGITLPAALSLYWTASTVIMAIEQLIIYRRIKRQDIEVIKTTHHGNG